MFFSNWIAKRSNTPYSFQIKYEYQFCSSKLDDINLRPATLKELVEFGKQYPKLKFQFPIVQLNPIFYNSNNYSIGILDHDNEKPKLLIYCGFGDWSKNCRFVALDK